jgi:hypothetical protein
VTKRVINLRDLAQDNLGFMDEIATDLVDGAERGLLRSIPLLVRETPVDTGQMASSWKVERADRSSVLLINDAPHAVVVEFGARPFTPPIGPLLAWAKRVLQDPQTPDDPNDPASYSKEVRSLAFAVRAKIRERGMEPHNIVENNMDAIMANIVAEWKAGNNG